MSSLESRNEEMEALEVWIDETEEQLYNRANVARRRRSSIILSDEFVDLVEGIKKDYEMKGFLKRRVQEEMDKTKAARPFTSAVFGTLREKNNTIMNFIKTLEAKQKEKREDERLKAAEKEAELVIEPLDKKLIEPKSLTNKPTVDLKGNPLKLSGERSNLATEGLFIGSIYVGRETRKDPEEIRMGDKSKSWRVKL